MKIIAIASPAGGVGKTTLAHAISVAAVEFGKKTLLIDLDPAGSLTFRLGLENPRSTIADYLTGKSISSENLNLTAERFAFIAADSRLTTDINSDALYVFLNDLPEPFDLVVLDVAPSLTQSLKLALSVADHIFTPVDGSLHSLRALFQLRALTEIKATAIAVGEVSGEEFAPTLDVSLIRSSEIDGLITGTLSALTVDKASEVAESYRSATYSILEILGLE
ncbi:MAG: AAA family ATPase [Actinomycetota bacterium]|nr:AAA family ATPase [Actinomycetota bacterium]